MNNERIELPEEKTILTRGGKVGGAIDCPSGRNRRKRKGRHTCRRRGEKLLKEKIEETSPGSDSRKNRTAKRKIRE